MTDPRQIELADAYQEACLALGEAVVMQRLIAKELQSALARITELEDGRM